MKGKNLLALVLCLALCLALAVPALGVETTVQDHTHFDDLKSENWSWAWPTVDDAIRRGLFIGYTPYTDSKGNTITNFGPGDAVTESVGLTLCARMMLDTQQRETILKDRLEQMRELIPGTKDKPDDPTAPFMWFRREAAACLELGIISPEELEFLRDADRLGQPMSKSDFAKYLVRAMGLEDFAKGLNANDLPFADDATIAREYRPFVKLLSTYGVLTGDENKNFNPNDGMNRAVCATMLSRAIQSIQEDREVSVELAKYTTYDWDAGYIQSVTLQDDGSRTMVIKSDFAQEKTVTLPGAVSLYQHNMKVSATELKVGTYAKVCYSSDGKIAMVRLTPAGFLSSVEGECDAVDEDTVTVDGVSYTLDRFTQVSSSGKAGDRSIIDPEAGYTTAKLVANSRKQVVSLELSGGTRLVDGVLTDLTTTNLGTTTQTTATVRAFNGLPTTYAVTDALAVSVNGRETESLQKSFEGRRVTLRVSDADLSKLVAVDVDAASQYVQGVLKNVNSAATPVRMEITRTGEVKSTPYEVDAACDITYEGKTTALKNLPMNVFVTAKVEGGVVTWLSAWTGMESTTGTLSGLVYADPTVLTVTREDGTTAEFSIPMEQLKDVTILVKGEDADITKLATGDKVTVTVRYHDVSQIDVTPRDADVTGILNAVTFNADGSAVLNIRFTDGSTKNYAAGSTTSVLRADKPVALTEIIGARGQTVSLVTEGDKALSVQFSTATVPQDQVEGVILNKDDQARVATVLVSGSDGTTRPVNVHIPSGTTINTAQGVTLNNITRLNAGDSVQVYGSYGANGTFEAKLVIRK